mmetsp:Transcript_32507/g.75134  ORF Transcript_32507/g.75134 Transcript_32507/m.75134 type:complete len:224 (-) Transcript_32507:377-1048(-)
MARVGIIAIHADGVPAQLLDQLQVPAAPVGPHGASDVSHEVIAIQWRSGLLDGSRSIRDTFHRLVGRVQDLRGGKGLVSHRTGLWAGHGVHLVHEGLELAEAGGSCMKTSILLWICIDVIVHRPIHSFPTQVVHRWPATNVAAGRLTCAFLGHTCAVDGLVASDAEALVGHALGQSTAGIAAEELALPTSVVFSRIVWYWSALVCLLVIVVLLSANASEVMAF